MLECLKGKEVGRCYWPFASMSLLESSTPNDSREGKQTSIAKAASLF